MPTLHALRRTNALSFSELSLLTMIPARRLAEFEYQGYPLSVAERHQLASFFGVAAQALEGGFVRQAQNQPALSSAQAQALAMLAATAALFWSLRLNQPELASFAGSMMRSQNLALSPALAAENPTPTATSVPTATPTSTPTATPTATATATATPTSVPTATPTATPTPTSTSEPTATPSPTPEPPRTMPQGCPLVPQRGAVILTQGYGVGTHAPAAQWGALDLAVSGGPTAGATVIATHAGRVTVTLNSWPGGNFVSITSETGYRTGYAHLQTVLVNSGDVVQAGAQIGTVGSTGYSTGPHLHYEIWRDGVNIDPTPLLQCS